MEKEKVVVANSALDYLHNLVYALYDKEYFGFLDAAEEYVNNIYDTIINDLPKLTHHKTPTELTRHGKHYITIKGSKRTTWYVIFNKKDNRFSVKLITNNHSPEAAYFNLR